MTIQVPTYFDPNAKTSYKADSCEPLREAWENNELELTTLARGTYPGTLLEEKELPGIRSIGYWNIKKLQDWSLEWHTNEGIEICFLESGNLEFLLKDQVFILQPNDITITKPWISHKLGTQSVGLSKLHWLIIDVEVRQPHQQWKWPDWIVLNTDDLKELTLYLRQNEQPLWKSNSDIRDCFLQIGKVIKQHQGRPFDSILKIQINNLLILLLEFFRHGGITLDQSLTESKRTVELFLTKLDTQLEEEWTVVKMAEYCQLGVTRFTHYCNEISNCSPMEYLNRLRLRRASKLLMGQVKLPIIDIAFMCGFSSNQYFNYAFKKHFKTTPKQYRKQNIKE